MSKLNLRAPVEYAAGTFAQLLREIQTQVNLLSEGKLQARYMAMTAAPTTGDWAQGDIVWNSAPSATGYIGWVCITAGTPGTWKGFGTIQA